MFNKGILALTICLMENDTRDYEILTNPMSRNNFTQILIQCVMRVQKVILLSLDHWLFTDTITTKPECVFSLFI